MRLRDLVPVLAISAAATAAPPKAKPEPAPPERVREIAHRLFDEAVAATEAGKLDVAISKYRDLERLSPHPNIEFNLAVLLEQRGKIVDAIDLLAKYVAAMPDDAAAAKHLAELRAVPGHVKLDAHTKLGVKAVWFFDGKLVAHDSQEIDIPAGRHRIDMVSEVGFTTTSETVEPGESKNRGNVISEDADQRDDGNVVISRTAAEDYGWFFKIDGSDRDDALGKGVHHSGRYQIAPGKHTIEVKDSVCDYDEELIVGKNELIYVYFDREGYDLQALLKDRGPKSHSPACGKLIQKRSVVTYKP